MTLTRRYGWFSGLALLLAGVLLVGIQAGMEGADQGEMPADVEMIPADGAAVLSFRLADLWAHDLVKPLREKLAKEAGRAVAEVEQKLGAAPEQIERLTVLVPAVAPDALLLVSLGKPYQRGKVAALAGKDAKEETFKGRTIFVDVAGRSSVGLLGPRAYAIGTADAIRSLVEQVAAKREGPLAEARRLAGEKHALVAGLNVPALAAAIPGLPGEVEVLQPLLEAKSATLVADLDTEARADLRLTFAGAAQAKKGARALREGVKLALGALAEDKKRLTKQAESAAVGELLDQVAALLGDVAVEQDSATVRAAAKAKFDPVALVPVVAEFTRKPGRAAGRGQSANNLKQLVLAMINYADTFGGQLPAHAIFGKDGKPLLSWRVLILPYLGEQELYKQFHLDEPWDSEHNKKLLPKMPKAYFIPGQKGVDVTHYQGFRGKGAVFEGKKGIRFPADFVDGTSNTIMVVEAATAVPWTKPDDLPYDPDKPLPKLGGLFEGGFNAGMADGSVRFISQAIKPTTLHIVIQRNDGQAVPNDF